MPRQRNDLIGKQIGRIVVISEDPNNKDRMICSCECGNYKSIHRKKLAGKGYVHSCGCLADETQHRNGVLASQRNFSHHYDLMRKYHTDFSKIENHKPSKNNKTGRVGVWYNHKKGNYVAYICLQRHKYHLGTFPTFAEAAQAREEAEDIYYAPLIAKKNRETIHNN